MAQSEKERTARRFDEVVVEVRDGKSDVTSLPATAVAFICNHDEAEEVESMGETYSMRVVRGPVDRSTLGPQLLKEKLHEKLREIDAVREGMTALIDHLPMEDAEELGEAFCSITTAQAEIMDAINDVLTEEPREERAP